MIVPIDMIPHIVDTFNNYDRIKFTVEYEMFEFSWYSIINKDNKIIIIDWYHKKTFLGRYLSFFFNHPTCHKVETIFGLVDKLLSNSSFYKKELKTCYWDFVKQPLKMIFDHINKRIKNLAVNRSNLRLITQISKIR